MLPVILLLAGVALTAPTATSTPDEVYLTQNPETLGAYVREYYRDDPILADIAWCESRFRHLGKDGEIFRGTVNEFDIGVMQINTMYHEEKADELGIDLHSLKGNLAYAQYLYDKQGTKPWNSSRPCWGKYASAK